MNKAIDSATGGPETMLAVSIFGLICLVVLLLNFIETFDEKLRIHFKVMAGLAIILICLLIFLLKEMKK